VTARDQIHLLQRPTCPCGGLAERNGRGDGYRTRCARCRKHAQKARRAA